MIAERQPRAARMFAVLGHELRNPLAASVAGVSAAAELTDPADPRRSFLDRALHDLDRVSGLLNRYLEFGRSGSVRGVRLDVADLLRRLAARHELRVAVDESDAVGGAAPLIIEGDGVLLERALENLVDNSRQAGAQQIRLAARRENGQVVVEVSDDGPGIAEGLRAHMFEPFVSGGTGSGLGLALVAEVLESHGGEICALPSEGGARFRITLPEQPARNLALSH